MTTAIDARLAPDDPAGIRLRIRQIAGRIKARTRFENCHREAALGKFFGNNAATSACADNDDIWSLNSHGCAETLPYVPDSSQQPCFSVRSRANCLTLEKS